MQLLEFLPIVALGFLGSFGHCAGMCGPLVVAFSLTDVRNSQGDESVRAAQVSQETRLGSEMDKTHRDRPFVPEISAPRSSHWSFQLWLNMGRLLGYATVGAMLGGLGEVTISGGQLAGVGSGLRQVVAIGTGLLLIWFGLMQVNPKALPPIPGSQFLTGRFHDRLSHWMSDLANRDQSRFGLPILLGSLWGLMPCGFLFAAQLKATGTGSAIAGLLTMLAFGLGTLPVMLGIGVSASWLSADRRGQLFRAAGMVAIAIGGLTVLRTDAMFDWTGHASLLLLIWALVARPLARWWPTPLRYRRAIGVAAFVLALGHLAHQAEHSLNWNVDAIRFMLPIHRYGLMAGITAILCMIPAALTSFDRLQIALGRTWRRLHLLTIPALICAVSHTLLSGSHYLGELSRDAFHYGRAGAVFTAMLMVFALRSSLFSRRVERSSTLPVTIPDSEDENSTHCCHNR
jgi:sulfite exporter TauE/SafE